MTEEIKPGTWVEYRRYDAPREPWIRAMFVGVNAAGCCVLDEGKDGKDYYTVSSMRQIQALPPEPRRIKKTVWITVKEGGHHRVDAYSFQPRDEGYFAIHGPLEIEFVEGEGL